MKKYTIVAPTRTDAITIVSKLHKAFRFEGLGIITNGLYINFATDSNRVKEHIIPMLIFSGYSANVKVNTDEVFRAFPFIREGATDEYYDYE